MRVESRCDEEDSELSLVVVVLVPATRGAALEAGLGVGFSGELCDKSLLVFSILSATSGGGCEFVFAILFSVAAAAASPEAGGSAGCCAGFSPPGGAVLPLFSCSPL